MGWEEESGASARETVEAVARHSYGKLLAYLAARTRDVTAAEDALSDAFAAALSEWPVHGLPINPEAWLFTVARRKDLNRMRRLQREIPLDGELRHGVQDAAQHTIPDERLGLLFACTHPAIDASIRAPLMLQTVLGLDAARVASAFLISPAAMSQRLVRAKEKIRQACIPFRIPEKRELPARAAAVLDAIYAAYTEGWADTTGADTIRRDLAEESIFLGRLVVALLPGEAEALGLLALMLHTEARRFARRDATGEYVPFAEQDPRQWNRELIAEAEALLLRASNLKMRGRYQLEAAIQSAHVHRKQCGAANWPEVVVLYDALLALTASPVVAINRVAAIAEVLGAAAALEQLNALSPDTRLASYQPYWAALAELQTRVGSVAEARRAYDLAIGLETDPAVRRFLQHRRNALPVV